MAFRINNQRNLNLCALCMDSSGILCLSLSTIQRKTTAQNGANPTNCGKCIAIFCVFAPTQVFLINRRSTSEVVLCQSQWPHSIISTHKIFHWIDESLLVCWCKQNKNKVQMHFISYATHDIFWIRKWYKNAHTKCELRVRTTERTENFKKIELNTKWPHSRGCLAARRKHHLLRNH